MLTSDTRVGPFGRRGRRFAARAALVSVGGSGGSAMASGGETRGEATTEGVCIACSNASLESAMLTGSGGGPWLLDSTGFPPRWQCGDWSAALGWTHVLSDCAIWGAYMAIPVVLGYFAIRGKAPLPSVTWLFVAFIASCGIGHLLEAIIFWDPVYRLAGAWKVVTASVSWLTVAALIPVVPRVLRLPTLEESNRSLEIEIERRNELEEELRRANRHLTFHKLALDEHAIVAITDARGVITYTNDKFCEISGYDRSELIGQTHAIVNSGEHPVSFFRDMWRTIAAGRTWRGEICNRAKDGHLYWVDTTIVPFVDEDERPTQYFAIRADVSDRVRFEQKLEHTVEELRDRGRELDTKNSELEQFTYSASHDLKSPLVTILGYCECIREDIAAARFEEIEQYVTRIDTNAERMRESIDDLLELSRIGRVDGQAERVDLAELVEEVLEDFAVQIEETGARVDTALEAASVWAVRERIKHAVQNLIANALMHGAAEEPRVLVGSALDPHTGVTTISVSDNGCGIAPEYHETIFDLFKSLSPDRQGTGVGLAIVKRVAESHGGRAWVESSPGEGATFHVTLVTPLTGGEVPDNEQ